MKSTTMAMLAAAPLVLAACAEDKMEKMEPMTPALVAAPQPAGGTVTVASATIAEDGFLVIHAIENGKPVAPANIGFAPIKAGMNTDVAVTLTRPSQPGDKVLAMLHQDTGAPGVYEFGPGSVEEDKPVVVDGKPVVLPVSIE